jgi:hypothetical protein
VKGDIETYHENGKWRNKVEGNSAPEEGTFDTKEPAVEAGRTLARERKVEHFIRNLDGKIGERNSYGHDPRNIPG